MWWRSIYERAGGRVLADALRRETPGSVTGDETVALSDDDVRKLLRGALAVRTYPELAHAASLDDVLVDGRCALLYLVTSDRSGHWTGVLRTPAGVEYFDSYGHAPDEPLSWMTPEKAAALHESQRELTRLLKGAAGGADGAPVVYNRRAFQSRTNHSMATCGRHVACRLMCNDMTLPQYAAMLASTGMDADEFVTRVTDAGLGVSGGGRQPPDARRPRGGTVYDVSACV